MQTIKENNTSVNEICSLQSKVIHIRIKEILYNSLSQACIKAYRTPHSILKLFLIVCICVASSLTSLLVIQSFIDYYKYEVSTTTRTIFEIPSSFPMVTICQSSPFTTLFSFQFLKEINNQYFNLTYLSSLDTESKFNLTWRLYLLATGKMNDRSFLREEELRIIPIKVMRIILMIYL